MKRKTLCLLLPLIAITCNAQEALFGGTQIESPIINKDGYYLMQKAKPITRIPDQTIREDLIEFPIIGNKKNIPCAVYYVFRDEIIKDLRKRKNEFER